MRLKACVVCGRPSPGARCSMHAVPDPDYGHAHRQRRQLMLQTAVGSRCVLCYAVMRASDELDLDHTTGRITHAVCNRRAGAKLVN